jgi:hypothetical protein
MSSTWHADDLLLARYVDGQAGPLDGASLEQHLLRCEHCRSRLATHVAAPPLELVWTRLREQAQAPAPGPVERLLVRLGVSAPDALLIAVAPSLRTSWLFGLAATLAFVVLSVTYGGARGLAFFLLVAPLVPVAGVAFAYGPDVDPTYEVSAAAPYAAPGCCCCARGGPHDLPSAGAGLRRTAAGAVLDRGRLAAPGAVVHRRGAGRLDLDPPDGRGRRAGRRLVGAVATAAFDRQPAAVLAPALLVLYAAVGLAAALVLRLRLRHLTLLGSLT